MIDNPEALYVNVAKNISIFDQNSSESVVSKLLVSCFQTVILHDNLKFPTVSLKSYESGILWLKLVSLISFKLSPLQARLLCRLLCCLLCFTSVILPQIIPVSIPRRWTSIHHLWKVVMGVWIFGNLEVRVQPRYDTTQTYHRALLEISVDWMRYRYFLPCTM
jgi:hypothetical protein